MKTLVIYHSKTGFTARYAKWLQEDISCDCLPYKKRKSADLSQYDCIVYGAGLHAGNILGRKWLLKRLPELSGKKLAVFFTGAMPPEQAGIEQAAAQNFTADQRQRIGIFYLWGGLNYENMGTADRFLMKLLQKVMRAKADPSPEEREMAKALESSFDRTDRKYLKPLEAFLGGKES